MTIRKTLVSAVRAGVPTANNRIYPAETLKRLAEDSDLQKRIQDGNLRGGVYDLSLYRQIGPDTHVVKNLQFDGESIVVDLEMFEDVEIKDRPVIVYTIPMQASNKGVINDAVRIHSIHVEKAEENGDSASA